MATLDIVTQQRSALLALYGLAFAVWQVSELDSMRASDGHPVRDILTPLCILVWLASAVLLAWQGRRHRVLAAGDEFTRAQRARALEVGYWGVLLVAAAGLVGRGHLALSGADALRLVLVVGIVIPAVTQCWLELRSDHAE